MSDLRKSLEERFGHVPSTDAMTTIPDVITTMAQRGSCRAFREGAVSGDLLETFAAVALCAPTKSDLQQRDIVILSDPHMRRQIVDLVGEQGWVSSAPSLVIFCGNNRRQRLLHEWKGIAFANDHLDAFFNAVVDAAIALGAFVTAVEAAGLGCCPISAVRNRAQEISEALQLPDHVFPVAGLAVGYPLAPPKIAMRLPLSATVHHNKYQEVGLRSAAQTYAAERAKRQPYSQQRATGQYGVSESYDWIDDKVRQYSLKEREGFAEYVRNKGFRLD